MTKAWSVGRPRGSIEGRVALLHHDDLVHFPLTVRVDARRSCGVEEESIVPYHGHA